LSLASHRLLGFAFASADLLLEVSATGIIAVAIGASEAISGAPETVVNGRPWKEFIDARDWPMVQALFDGSTPGRRGGPVVVTLAATGGPECAAALSTFCLPGNDGAISCALTRAAPKATHGLHDKSSFEAVTTTLFESAQQTGLDLELALVEMGGLTALRQKVGPDAAKTLDERLTGILLAQSYGGAAAQLAEDRFALVRQHGEPADGMTKRVLSLLALAEGEVLTPQASSIPLRTDAASPGQAVRAIRYSLDTFIKDGLPGVPPGTLDDAVTQSVKRTLSEVSVLQKALNGRDFRLIYQPVVDLKANSKLHHHEVLVRFGDDASPFPMIRMAEELDLIQLLDIAVVERTVQKLMADTSAHLAVNVSGRTIVNADFMGAVKRLLAAHPAAKKRLMFELTESSAIDDLGQADRHLQMLRGQGCLVCLDDFGAGAASLAYLQHLSLDIVKIDGRYIRDIEHGGRQSTFIKHLVNMCGEMGVKTLAEMVESPEAEDAVRKAGVDYAQGWLYGPGAETPQPPINLAASANGVRPAVRRVGAVEGWG